MRTTRPLLSAAAVLLLLGAACAKNAEPGGTEPAASADVTFTQDAMELDPTSVPAGAVVLHIANDASVTHEVELFKGDADPSTIEIANDVAVTTPWELVDEQEEITPGARVELSADLEPGTYQVVCNLPGHFAQGFHATLTVT